MRYRDLSYNAFTTDHRWLRLLHEYIQTYSMMAGVEFPAHIDALRLLVSMADAPQAELANMILREGLTVPEAVNSLLNALACPIPSVRRAVENGLLRLYPVLGNDIRNLAEKRTNLSTVDDSEKKNIKRLLEKTAGW